ncbi:MAG: aminotransferase class III-fold pyridoxal phosphate-dependent enzyme [Gammaproteobacteria bacterium]|nr:aminotransferase class III-fold pyridoxal phosphate-dependent enzyme [Gammaproteobacteria bacterium]
MSATTDLLKRREALLGPAYRLFYEQPVHLVRGEGVHLYDADGHQYLDMYNNVPHVGHCHPRVVAALTEQIATLNTHTRYLHHTVIDYAERLTGKLPEELDTAMFTCTGTEANELALRIARTVTGGTGIVVVDHAYHGNSQAIAEISPCGDMTAELPEFVKVASIPNTYSGEYRGADAAGLYARSIAAAVEDLHAAGIQLAAVVLDTIVSGPGVVEPPDGYLAEVAKIARSAGGLFIADEVQPGFGRTGRHFWGFESDSFIPDIVTMGKPMGNGHPMAAVVTRADILKSFAKDVRYFNTFGGNPVSCAAGMAVLDVLEDEDLQANALRQGEYLKAGLMALADEFEILGDIRGHGLFLAVELVADRNSRAPATESTERLVNDLKTRRVLTGSIGPYSNILKFRPPMVFSQRDGDRFLDVFAAALANLNS